MERAHKSSDNIQIPPNRQQRGSGRKTNRKGSKFLPMNFFEKVLELDMRLKREFTMESLQELVNLYSTAIEYYESIEDPRYKDYQNRLNILLSQPDILKSMNDFYKKKNGDGKNTNLDNDIDNIQGRKHAKSTYQSRMKKEQEKKQIKMKINFISQVNGMKEVNEKIDKMMKNINIVEESEEKEAERVVDNELVKQTESFKLKLEEKRKKQQYMNLSNELMDNSEIRNREKKFNTIVNGVSLRKDKDLNNVSNNDVGNIKDNDYITKNIPKSNNKNDKDDNKDYNDKTIIGTITDTNNEKFMTSPIKIDSDKINDDNINDDNIKINQNLNTTDKAEKINTLALEDDNYTEGFNIENIESARTKKTEQTAQTNQTEKTTVEVTKENLEINLENSFEKFEKEKIDEIDEIYSPFVNLEGNTISKFYSGSNTNANTNISDGKGKDIFTTMFKLNENVFS